MSDRLKPLLARAIEGPLGRAQAEAAFDHHHGGRRHAGRRSAAS